MGTFKKKRNLKNQLWTIKPAQMTWTERNNRLRLSWRGSDFGKIIPHRKDQQNAWFIFRKPNPDVAKLGKTVDRRDVSGFGWGISRWSLGVLSSFELPFPRLPEAIIRRGVKQLPKGQAKAATAKIRRVNCEGSWDDGIWKGNSLAWQGFFAPPQLEWSPWIHATGICRDSDKIVTELEDSRTNCLLCKQARVWSTGAASGTSSSVPIASEELEGPKVW